MYVTNKKYSSTNLCLKKLYIENITKLLLKYKSVMNRLENAILQKKL